MTVRELIEKLKEMPGDYRVACDLDDYKLEITEAKIVNRTLHFNLDEPGIMIEFVELI